MLYVCREHVHRPAFCATLSFDKIDDNNNNNKEDKANSMWFVTTWDCSASTIVTMEYNIYARTDRGIGFTDHSSGALLDV